MAVITNNISGSSSDGSKIGITGSIIISNAPDSQFPSLGTDAVFFVSGSESAKSVFGGAAKISGSLSTDSNVILGNSSDDIITVSGSAKFNQGLSGSLTKLADGSSYIIAGSNITVSSASNGSITIAGSGGSTTAAGSDTYVQFNDGGTSFGGDSGLTYNKTTDALTLVGALSVGGTASISGSLFTNGNVQIGDASGDTLTINATAVSIPNNLNFDSDTLFIDVSNNYVGIGTLSPARPLHIMGAGGWRASTFANSSGFEFINVNGPTWRLNPIGAATNLEIWSGVTIPTNGTAGLGFNSAAGQTADTLLYRTTAGILNLSGSSPGFMFKWIATSTPTVVGQFGMNISSGRPQAFISGTVRQLAHMNELVAGDTGQVQFNNSGVPGASSTLTFSTAGNILTSLNMSATAITASSIIAGTTSVDLLNTTATTINFGGAATSLNVGQSIDTNIINVGNANTADTKTQTINIGAGTGVTSGKSVVTIGSNANASSLTLQAGTGHVVLSGSTTTNYTVGSALGTGTITIGSSTKSNTISIGGGTTETTAAQTIQIANGTTSAGGSTTVSIATAGAASSAYGVAIGGASSTGTITVGQSTGTNTINIGTGQTANGLTQTINVGTSATGTGKATVTIGNTNGASSIVLNTGTGNTLALGGSLSTGSVAGSLEVTGNSVFSTVIEPLLNSNNSGGVTTFSLTNQSIFYVNGASSNITANFTNAQTTNNRIISTTVILSQSATARIVSAVQINGVASTINWANNVTPTGNSGKQDIFGFSLIRSGSAWKSLGQMTTYG